MNGAEAMVKCLEAEGITRIFGYPGVAIAPFYEAMDKSIRSSTSWSGRSRPRGMRPAATPGSPGSRRSA